MPKESMRYRTTKEEREQMVINRGNPTNSSKKVNTTNKNTKKANK